MNRRGFLGGLIAAPAIVAASNIMPVRSIERLAYPTAGLDKAKFYALGDIINHDGAPYIVVETSHHFERGQFSEHLGVRSLLEPAVTLRWNVNYNYWQNPIGRT